MLRRGRSAAVMLALATAGVSMARAQAPSPSAGAREAAAVVLGDSITPHFLLAASDTSFAQVKNGSVIVKGCGVLHIFLRIYHRGPTGAQVYITADTASLQVVDTTATTGSCAPAGPPGACTIDGSSSVDPAALPAPACNLSRNRFLADSVMNAALDRFIARTYAPPP